ncbi:MAG TPA: hypothetical protein DIT66_09005 [Rhodobiaceae bacterium]|nr:hypothetical protein [Rhodobiaceae bacterium]
MDKKTDKTGLTAVREKIDALDAEMRSLLLARARLVEDVARSKAGEPDAIPLRPGREMQQMQALVDWHHAAQLPFPLLSLLAVWREIIGAALVQQGGLVVHICAETAALARNHFGVALNYHIHATTEALIAACDADPRSVGIIPLDISFTPKGSARIFARLPLLDAPEAVCYGAVPFETTDTMVTLIRASADGAQNIGTVLAQNGDAALVEIAASLRADEIADSYGDKAVWLGNYDLLQLPEGRVR